MEVLKAMGESGNPNSASDAGVGALCARSAVMGAFLNVKINAGGLNDKAWVAAKIEEGEAMVAKANQWEKAILSLVEKHIA